MATVTRTELNQQTAKVLARVAAGETLTITDRGRPIAQLSPPQASVWDDLIAAGHVRLPSQSGALNIQRVKLDQTSAEIINDLRADRL
ncbi:type II toxin-antitoxin system prevent-host-death family antitoxin [Microbacterium sp. LWH10-1.2]|uniref:type II toxin-antitoxin system Phd/YefM family antitoxin n=1 Tax=Microbacterium sp. LWH10-1.2 TaxID=3135255 RepID=UPI003139742E